MRTILLTIEYDGTDYCGWQKQPNGVAIQQVVEQALQQLLHHEVTLLSSGRTDAGVHALAMPAAFTTNATIPLVAFVEGVNRFLPPDIAIHEAREVHSTFRPIKDAIAKHYRYTILKSAVRRPLDRYYCWHIRETLDVAAMQAAAAHFIGTHHFGSFRGSNSAAQTSERRIDFVKVTRDDEKIYIDVQGGGFLKNMVRIMAGTLVDIGRGRFMPNHITTLLQHPDRSNAGVTAPAYGLCLIKVYYDLD